MSTLLECAKDIDIEHGPGVYIVTASDGMTLYAGASMDVKKRLKLNAHNKSRQLNKYPAEVSVDIIRCEKDELCEIEEKYIHELNPIYNRSVHGWSYTKPSSDCIVNLGLFAELVRQVVEIDPRAMKILRAILAEDD